MSKDRGCVYILTNKSFRDNWIKIGKTSNLAEIRSRQLDNTSMPLPFEVYATLETSKYSEVEVLLHKTIDRLSDLRIRQNREFFNIDPEEAYGILKDISCLLDDATISEPAQAVPCSNDTDNKRRRKENFRFSMIGLKPGDTITFTPTNTDVKVNTDKKIEYEGRLYTLSAFAGTFMPDEQRNSADSYVGPAFFTYNGESLVSLRDKYESSEDKFAEDISE